MWPATPRSSACSVGGPHAERVIGDAPGGLRPRGASLLLGQPGLSPAGRRGPLRLGGDPGRGNRRPHLLLRGRGSTALWRRWATSPTCSPPYLVGHCRRGRAWRRPRPTVWVAGRRRRDGRRAALVHDLGRVAVPRGLAEARTLTADEWERVRLHPYHTERVLAVPRSWPSSHRSRAHHERLDGAGYHRGATAAIAARTGRLLAAADAYHAMTEPRPYRPALRRGRPRTPHRRAAGGKTGRRQRRRGVGGGGAPVRARRVGRPGSPNVKPRWSPCSHGGSRPSRSVDALGISAKTADRHVQNAYAKIGVSTRAAAALFAMQHGLATWGELPIPPERATFIASRASGDRRMPVIGRRHGEITQRAHTGGSAHSR